MYHRLFVLHCPPKESGHHENGGQYHLIDEGQGSNLVWDICAFVPSKAVYGLTQNLEVIS